MSENTEAILTELIDAELKRGERLGADPTPLRIYLEVFFADEPLTVKQLTERTGYSTTLVSNTMPLLLSLFDIEVSKKPGSKTRFYSCTHDVTDIIRKKCRTTSEALDDAAEELKVYEERLSALGDDRAKDIRKKLVKSRRQLEALLKNLTLLTSCKCPTNHGP